MLPPRTLGAALLGSFVLGMALAGGGLSGRMSPDGLLTQGYRTALEDQDTAWITPPRNVWLSSLAEGASGARGLATGDTITLSGRDGQPEAVEVIEIAHVDGDRLGLPGVRFKLVTGRTAGQAPGTVVRFLFSSEAPEALPPTLPADRHL